MERRGRLNGITLLMSHSLPGFRTHTNTHCGQKDGAGEPGTWAVMLTPPPSLLSGSFSRFRFGDDVWNFCWVLQLSSLDFGVYLGQGGMFSGSGNVDSGSLVRVVGSGCKPGLNQI